MSVLRARHFHLCFLAVAFAVSCSNGASEGRDAGGGAHAPLPDASPGPQGGGDGSAGFEAGGDASAESGEAAMIPQAPTAVGCHEVVYTPSTPVPERGDLCLPTAVQRGLGVILVHGGGTVQGSRDELIAWQNFFVGAGAVTLNIDYYLVGDTTPSPVFPRVERNVKAAVQYLRANASRVGIDPNRIVLLGTSAGARLGGIVHTTPDDAFFAGDGRWKQVSDRSNAFIGLYGGYDGKLATGASGLTADRYYGGDANSMDPAVQQRYAKADARMNAAAASGPVLLFHGDEDTTAPPLQSTRFDAALRTARVDSTLVIVPGAAHSFDRRKSLRRPFTPEGEQAAARALEWLHMRFGQP